MHRLQFDTLVNDVLNLRTLAISDLERVTRVESSPDHRIIVRVEDFKMASRRPPTKRFKPAKIRAKCVSTLGKTTKISFPLKLSSPNAAKSSTCDTSNNITSTYCQISDINDNSHEEDDIDAVKKTAYQQRREKQYYSWESIRQNLLNGRIEEEAFLF